MHLLETPRLIVKTFHPDMAADVSANSYDEAIMRFVPDEHFPTEEDALAVISYLMECYNTSVGPFVYPVFLKDGVNIGYVQLVPIDEGFEVGYHVAPKYINQGYATEALTAFLPWIMKEKSVSTVYGIVDKDNHASIRVLEKCRFVYDQALKDPKIRYIYKK